MSETVKVLMVRDGNTEQEAIERVKEVRELFAECNYDADECESILAEYLGLEMDYIFDIL